MGGEVTAVGGNGRFARAADEGEGEIAQGGQDLGGLATAQAGVILAEGDIADVVALVLATPVGTNKVQQPVGRGRRGGQAGDEVDDLPRGGLLGAHGACELPHLG